MTIAESIITISDWSLHRTGESKPIATGTHGTAWPRGDATLAFDDVIAMTQMDWTPPRVVRWPLNVSLYMRLCAAAAAGKARGRARQHKRRQAIMRVRRQLGMTGV